MFNEYFLPLSTASALSVRSLNPRNRPQSWDIYGFFFALTELLLTLGRGNDLVPEYNDPTLLEHFRADIYIEGGEKDLSLGFFYSYKRDVLFELFNGCDNVADGLLLALFESA
jgi:hypothetical protein